MAVEWRSAETQPEGAVCMTKIDDKYGCRNEAALRRSGNLWFTPDGEMYVYYRPTHYRPLTEDEAEKERSFIRAKAARLADQAERIDATSKSTDNHE